MLGPSPSLARDPLSANPKPNGPDIAAFVQEVDALRRTAQIPGLSVAVVKDQALVLALGLGYADPERGVSATAVTPYNIASVTKPISAVVALRLAEVGVLDLDRPMAEYSEWEEFCRDFAQQPSIFAQGLRCDPCRHTLRHLLSHTATSEPGDHFSYNPLLYSWASRPMMSATDATFSSLVAQHVFGPAGMTRSARTNRDLPLREDLALDLAPPHRSGATGEIERGPAPPVQGDGAAGGVITTVLDLAKFDLALDRGVLITAQSRTAMMTPAHASSGATHPYGLGWFVQEHRGRRLVWHAGWWDDAYSALYLKIPDLGLTFIILANSEGIWWDNPLDRAEVERSPFAQSFLRTFVGE
ncbi:MAG: beta-lactamase family protein [Candidatus Eisenbacteria bacterium]|nr:beta-lactamase family protein [Candidatus Eisenbacteria bacterium]